MVETAQIVISLAIFKVLNFVQVMKYINLTLMSHILLTSGNETIGEQTGDYYPVCYNAFTHSAQSAKTLQNALRHRDQRR